MKTMEKKVSSASEYYIFSPSRIAQKMFLYPTQCGLFIYEPGYALSRVNFDSFLLMYVQKGQMTLQFEGRRQMVPEKHFVFIDCYQRHGYATETGSECLWLHFDGVLAREYYSQIVARLGNVFAMENAFAAVKKMQALLAVFAQGREVREALFSKFITDILTEMLLCPPGDKAAGSGAEMAERTMTYIAEHFTEQLSVTQLASMSGWSPYHFIRVFHRETGYTPHEYVVSRRMAAARYLLRYTECSVKEICYQTGFTSESVFCNAFKKQQGVTPQQFREGGYDRESALRGTRGGAINLQRGLRKQDGVCIISADETAAPDREPQQCGKGQNQGRPSGGLEAE